MAYRYRWLTPPTRVASTVSVVLALLAVLVWLGVVHTGMIQGNLFETLLIAYLVLLAGNLIRGV